MSRHVGIRLHVFSRPETKKDVLNICDVCNEMFKTNRNFVSSRKIEKNKMDHDLWKVTTSVFEFARQVGDVYNRNFDASSDLDKDFKLVTTDSHPFNIFSLMSNGFQFEKGCDLQNDVSNYMCEDGSGFRFPDESRIYRMMPTDLMPDRFFFKYLPDYFFNRVKYPEAVISGMRIENNMNVFAVSIEKRLERQKYLDVLNEHCISHPSDNTWVIRFECKKKVLDCLKNDFIVYEPKVCAPPTAAASGIRSFVLLQEKMSELRVSEHCQMSDSVAVVSPLINSLLTNKHSLSDFAILKYQCEYKLQFSRGNRRKFQEEMMKEFKERIWDDAQADISEPAMHILLWKNHKRNASHMNFNFKKLDKNMTVFGNRCIRVMDFYDRQLFVSAQHKTLFLLNHAKYDAYRTETNLHFNQIYTGEGATSKSFLFEKMDEQSILGTVETLTYQTKRADAIDGDTVDIIQIFNEAPPGMFMTHQNSDGEAEAMFKEKLTSQIVRTKEFYRDEATGDRKNRVAKSQNIGVVMGATNDDPSQCQEAMATRFYWGQFEKVDRKEKSVQTCMRGERDMRSDKNTLEQKERWLSYMKEEQLRVWLVFKLIYVKILMKPTLRAADIVYDQLANSLKRRYKVNIAPRTKERYEILCTIFTIVNALEIVFNVDGGLHANDAFDPMHILDIEPYLFCTEEIAVFAFTHIQEEFVNANEYKVLDALWRIHKNNENYMEIQESEHGATRDFSYCKFNKFNRLLTEVSNSMDVTSGRMSKHNIQALLNSLKDRTISGRPYVSEDNSMMVEEAIFNDTYPQPKENAVRKEQFALMVQQDGTYIHMDLFEDIRREKGYVDKVKECIKSLQHKYSYCYRKFVLGSNIRESNSIVCYPNLFDTISLQKSNQDRRTITMSNPLYVNDIAKINNFNDDLSEKQSIACETIFTDLTIAGAITHAQKLHMNEHSFLTSYTEKMKDFTVEDKCYEYPNACIEMYKKEKEDKKRMMRHQQDTNNVEAQLRLDMYEPSAKRSRLL